MAYDPAPVWDALLAWYARQGRTLPWRQTRDPYHILVSEIMLQQTQVDRVIPKYQAFLLAFPSFAALAAAPTEAVIREWSGLGYNQRAVRLQQIARAVMEVHDGHMPTTITGLLTLPGVGRYTAGALACFALGQAVATVDTNIRRVLGRIFIGEFAPALTQLTKPERALALAEAVLPPTPAQAYDWNQALMDLGATVCTARAPACERCPVAACCQTYAQVAQHTLFPSGGALRDLLQERQIAEETGTYAVPKRPKKERPFKESNRYFRGRVVEALRELASGVGLTLADLGPQVKADYQIDQEAWLREVVTGLVRDGLARWDDAEQLRVTLPR